jgi:RNA polymerase sigma-70 factor (ECF subfamily)
MATRQEMSDFLTSVERRAYKQTTFAVRDDQLALDIVQDAMLKLVEKYSEKPISELPMLFQRILQNTMRDYWRRQKIRNLWTTLLSSFSVTGDDGQESDPLEVLPGNQTKIDDAPDSQLNRQQTIALIEEALKKLPARQREAFLMRYWEEMDVAETATAMGCSQGSVKTHCSRAIRSLSLILKEAGINKDGWNEKGGNGWQ